MKGSYAAKAQRRRHAAAAKARVEKPASPVTLAEHLTRTRCSLTTSLDCVASACPEASTVQADSPVPRSLSRVAASVKRLAVSKAAVVELREQLKRQQEDAQSLRPSRRLSASVVHTVTQRLHRHASEAARLKEKSHSRAREAELLHCSFLPTVHSASNLRQPLHERAAEEQAARRKFRQKLRQSYEDPELTFSPFVSARSAHLAASPRPRRSRTEDASPPAPPLKKSITHVKLVNRPKPKQKHEEPSHSPVINLHSRCLVETRRGKETSEDKAKRLSEEDYARRVKCHAEVQVAQYAQYTFQPRIDQISQALARPKSLAELAARPPRQKPVPEECSFHPSLKKHPKYARLQSQYQQGSPITQSIQAAQLSSAAVNKRAKDLQEYTELKPCTFKPKTLKLAQPVRRLIAKVTTTC